MIEAGSWHKERCEVCNGKIATTENFYGTKSGPVHRSCARKAQEGKRWLKGLEAPQREVPIDQRSLLSLREDVLRTRL